MFTRREDTWGLLSYLGPTGVQVVTIIQSKILWNTGDFNKDCLREERTT
jgi:hypothetical protein